MTTVVTAEMQAEYDEAMGLSQELLERLVASYVVRRAEDVADGLVEPLTVMAMVRTLQDHWTHDQLLSALSAAVVAIAAGLESGDEPAPAA